MPGKQNNDIPFILDEEDEEVFSSVDSDEEVFSSAPAAASGSFATGRTPSGAFGAVPSSAPKHHATFGAGRPAVTSASPAVGYGGGAAPQPQQQQAFNPPPAAQSGSFQGSVRINTGGFPAVQPQQVSAPTHQQTTHQQPVHQPQPAAPPRTGAPRVVVLGPQDEIQGELTLSGARMLLGSGHVDFPLRDPFVSRHHAQIFADQGAYMLEDVSSQNGVYLRIADEFQLEDGDELAIGHQHFIFHHQPTLRAIEPQGPADVHVLGSPQPRTFPHLLHVFDGGLLGGLYPLRGQVRVGRGQVEICCPNDAALEHHHATLEERGGRFFLRDNNSRFGTYIRVNDPIELISGDCFLIGRTRMRIFY